MSDDKFLGRGGGDQHGHENKTHDQGSDTFHYQPLWVRGERKGRIRNLRKNGVAFSTAEGRTRPGDRNREASTRLLLRGPPVPRKSLSHAAGIPRLLRHTPFPSIPTPRITHPSTKIKCRCRISVKPRSTPAHGYRVPPFALISPRPLFFSVDAPRAHV